MMEKIKLTNRGKQILFLLKECKYKVEESDYEELNLLMIEGLGQGTKGLSDSFITYQLTEKGKAYLLSNPKLNNPSIFDDKKYIVTTIISIIALILSIIK